MPRTTSSPLRETRSARFLIEPRPTGAKPTAFTPLTLLPNLIRLAEVASMLGLDNSFLLHPAKINEASAIDKLISQFLHEVNDYHFPVQTDYWLDDETLQHPALQGWIPVKPKGFDSWHHDDPITLLMALAGLEYDPHPALDVLETEYSQFDIPWGFLLSNLPPILSRMDHCSPVSALPDLIRIATRRTGSFFLDYSAAEYDFYEDRGANIYWSSENVEWLKADWARAKPLHARAWELIGWVMEDQEKRTAVLMDLVLEAHQMINP